MCRMTPCRCHRQKKREKMFHPFLVLATSKPENDLKRLGWPLRLGLGVNKIVNTNEGVITPC